MLREERHGNRSFSHHIQAFSPRKSCIKVSPKNSEFVSVKSKTKTQALRKIFVVHLLIWTSAQRSWVGCQWPANELTRGLRRTQGVVKTIYFFQEMVVFMCFESQNMKRSNLIFKDISVLRNVEEVRKPNGSLSTS